MNDAPTNRFGFPQLGFGLGLRHPHYDDILGHWPREVDFFEIISEDFLDAHEGHWQMLADLRQHYPILMHGVSLSVGSPEPLQHDYLRKLKKLADFLNVPWLSDHVCWTGVHGINTHDLLPVPYTEAALTHFTNRVKKVQDVLGRPLVLENPSTYLHYAASTMPEYEFLARLADNADCGILLDVNNVYVSAFNHRYDAHTYLDALPADRVVQIHLAGHLHKGTHIIDTHDNHVAYEVWALYERTIRHMGSKTTMIEWDAHIPPFATLRAELDKARATSQKALTPEAAA